MNRVPRFLVPAAQRGVTTLVVVLSLLVIITLLVLASTNMALFEQRTTTNENRQKLADQAAEYAMNLGGEYMKSNLSVLATASGAGWLASGASKRWWSCAGKTTGPCLAERDTTRRGKMYYWSSDSAGAYTEAAMAIPLAGTGTMTTIGGEAGTSFPVKTTVYALLCRIDTTLTSLDSGTGTQKPAPDCALTPSSNSLNRVAIVLTSTASLVNSDGSVNENATSTIKETWANYSGTAGASAVPLIASGSIEGLGNAEIVAAANGAGVGLPVSIWSSCPVDIDKAAGQTYPGTCVNPSGSGVGSVSTCNLGEFLKNTPEADLKTTCATSNVACGCPSFNTSNSDFLSGHSNSQQRENIDILDVDNNVGSLPDITFFPDRGMDSATDSLDDNLFEWIFGQEAVAEGATSVSNCGGSMSVADTNLCADVDALVNTLGATVVATCASLNSASSGLYYVTGDCDLPTQVGNANESVIVVVDGDAQGANGVRVSGNTLFYGMLFIRSRYTMESASNQVKLTGNGGVQFYGSVVVEGNVKITGSIRIVYENTNTDVPGKALPASTRFARVPGSWLDSQTSF